MAWFGRMRPYAPNNPSAPSFRARQLQALLRLTPLAMGVNVSNAVAVCAITWAQVSHALMLAWASAITTLAVLGWRGWQRGRTRVRTTASVRALHHAVGQAAVLAALWALLPLCIFAGLDAGAKFFVGMVVTGMICAGGFALSTVPAAATAWVAVLGTGSALALWRSNLNVAGGAAVLLSFYCLIVVFCAWSWSRSFGARLVAESRADHQSEVIGLLLRDFEDHASDLLWEIDARGRFRHVSQRLASAFGMPAESLLRLRATRLLQRAVPADPDADSRWRVLLQHLARGSPFREQVVAIAGTDGPGWWALSARPLLDDEGRADGWRGVASNVTDRHLAHRRLTWLAHNDALTGLVNRTQFRELLHALLAGTPAPPLAVLSIDLDDFKLVNDGHGHAAGDELLRVVGERLLSVARRSDTVARLGGDEFAMLVRGVSTSADLTMLLGRVRDALGAPVDVRGRVATPRASIGVAFSPANGTDVDTLMNHADIALYAAKTSGGNRWRFFEHAMADAGRRRNAIAEALRHAVERGEFSLAFQPQVSSGDGRVCGFEALLRWRHAEHGEVSPAEFVPIAEGAGLMPEIGAWVLNEACREAARWPAGVRVSVNVSATQLGGKLSFVERVEFAARGLDPDMVELEITESALVDDIEGAVATLSALRARGFRIALDDFGTGYSALGYLRRFPFDTLKIDRSFVREMASDDESRGIVETILAMSRVLGMTAVAEGVELPSEVKMLQALGCATLQGFLIARPLPAAEVGAFLTNWQGNQRAVSSFPALESV
ncbi:MAG: EAL domain-containing protein [Proteobacteria bacterium]|nr:EAL domain-containing protein [Pseudomonadota bacterium]